MLPGDILGVSIFERKSSSFVFHPGPIFSQVLLADEINRATPKTQSALLEAMEERQVTIEGKTRSLEKPFFVIATQNPIEQSGTFPLPESQLDRFLMRINLGYPNRKAEKELLKQGPTKSALDELQPMLSNDDVLILQKQVAEVHISDALLDYAQDLLEFTRDSTHFFVGLSPRAGLNLLMAAKARAFMHERDYALPEDLQKVLPWVVGHRLRSREEGLEFSREKLASLFSEVAIP
jgi:MoxR-like ATPase